MLEYYWLLRRLIRERPELRRCLCRCRHCRIFFLTDARNAGRCDLGCPFGCREAHRKRESTRRSVAYYREEEGKLKKRMLNSKRCRVVEEVVVEEVEESVPESCVAQKKEEADKCDGDGDARQGREVVCPWSRPLVEHVRVLIGLIEGRRFSHKEVVQMLWEVLRQHSMARWRRVDHLVAHLHRNPP